MPVPLPFVAMARASGSVNDPRWIAVLREDGIERRGRAVTGYHRQSNRRLCRAATRQSIVERHEICRAFEWGDAVASFTRKVPRPDPAGTGKRDSEPRGRTS